MGYVIFIYILGMWYTGATAIRSFYRDVCTDMKLGVKNPLYIISTLLWPIFCVGVVIVGLFISVWDFSKTNWKEKLSDFWNWR